MNHTGTRKSITLLGLLLAPVFFWAQSNALTPYKITVFQDAVQVSQKGIVRFHQQKAEVPLTYEMDPERVNLVANGEFDVAWVRFRQDSVLKMLPVENWAEVLKANISRSLSVVYEIAGEFDEIDGNVRWVDEEKGLLLMHGADGAEYFLPLKQIRQVIVDSFSDYQIKKKSDNQVLEIKLDKDAPFVPLEMFSLHKGISWDPVCRIRVISSDKAYLEQDALLINQLFDLPAVAVEVSTGSILADGQLSGEIMELGELSLQRGDEILVNFRKTELSYNATYQSRIPWGSTALGSRNDFSAKSLMRFELPASSSFPCDQYAVIDENNRNIANINIEEAKQNGQIVLDLGTEKGIKVSCVEVEKKRGKKPVKIGDKSFLEIEADGKVIVLNLSNKYIEIDVTREIKGNITTTGGGKVAAMEGSSSIKEVTWRVTVDPGQKKEVKYKFDFLDPVN